MSFVVIEVPRADRRDKPVYIGGDMFKGTFKRNHEGDYLCTKEEIRSMLRDQVDTPQDSLVLENLLISDLNQESIYRYRILLKNLKPDHIWTKLQDGEFLVKIGAAKKSQMDGKLHPTLGGLLFFGDFINIIDELPNFFLDYREKLSTSTRWTDRVCSSDGNWSGNVFDFYYKVVDRLTADVKKPFKLDSRLHRIDDTPVHKSLRESLANALIHADYYGRRGVVIDKEFRKVTISNPGSFRLGVDEAISGGISDARNGRIFNMFSLINVGERAGTGLCKLYNVWEENGFKKPILTESVNPDRVTLTLYLDELNDGVNDKEDGLNDKEDGLNDKEDGLNDKDVGLNDKEDGLNDKDVGLNGKLVGLNDKNDCLSDEDVGLNVCTYSDLSNTENIVYWQIKENPSLITTEIANNILLSKRTIERAINRLKKKGYIKREGSKKIGKWIVQK